MNTLENLILLNQRLDGYARMLAQTRQERDTAVKCLMLAAEGLGRLASGGDMTQEEIAREIDHTLDILTAVLS